MTLINLPPQSVAPAGTHSHNMYLPTYFPKASGSTLTTLGKTI
jgi:hypothetical protein